MCFIDYIATLVQGGEKCLFKMYLSLNHTRDKFKDADSSSNETSTSWVSHS